MLAYSHSPSPSDSKKLRTTDDLKRKYRQRFLSIGFRHVIIACFNFSVFWFFTNNPTLAWIYLSQCCVSVLLFVHYIYTKNETTITLSFIFLFVYFFIESLYIFPYSRSYALMLIFIPVVALFIFNKIVAFALAFVVSFTIIGIIFAVPFFPWQIHLSTQNQEYLDIACIFTAIYGIFLILYAWHIYMEHLVRELTNQQNALETAHEKLLELQQVRNRFFASMSHEIRTPMNAIRGVSQILDIQLESDTQIKEYLGVLRQSSSHLLNLINDILDLSKIEEGRLSFEYKSFHLEQLLQECCSMITPILKTNIKFELNIQQPIPTIIYSDPLRLKQVIINLLNNAITYTHSGTVSLSCSLSTLYPSSLLIEVQDTGIGIPAHLHRKIFEGYVQVNRKSQQNFGGTGLGLSISKKIVDQIQGKISVESAIDVGSTFFVHWPYLTVTKPENQAVTSDVSCVSAQVRTLPCQILLVDDNDSNITILSRLLKKKILGCQITLVKSGIEAIQYLKNHSDIQVILMDMSMPEMDGLECSRLIRALPQPQFKEIPIIAITANAYPEDEKACYEAGMNDFVAKPIDIDTLVQKIEVWVKRCPTSTAL